MKIKLKKAASILLAAGMLIGLLAGCGGKDKGPDPVQEVLGYSKNTVYFTVDGEDVTAEDYLLWLVQEIEYINSYYKAMGNPGIAWDEDIEGVTAREYLKEQTKETAKLVVIMEQLAKDEGFSFDKEDQASFDEERAQVVEAEGGQEAYDRYLLEMCITDASMDRVNRASVLYEKMYEGMFAEGGKYETSEADLLAELQARNIMRAKHILLLTGEADLDAKPYSEEKIAEQRVLAEDLLSQIQGSADQDQTFNDLMNQYSEDTGLAGNPDGYVFTTEPDYVLFNSRMVPEFEEGTMALAVGEISGIVESQYGFHIIQRLDPLEDANFREQFETLWSSQRIDEMLQERMNNAEMKTTEAFDELDAETFYENLLAYRDRLAEADKAEDAKQPEEETGDPAEGDGDADQPDPADTPDNTPANPANGDNGDDSPQTEGETE